MFIFGRSFGFSLLCSCGCNITDHKRAIRLIVVNMSVSPNQTHMVGIGAQLPPCMNYDRFNDCLVSAGEIEYMKM